MKFPAYPKIYSHFIDDTLEIADKNRITIRVSEDKLVYENETDKTGCVGYFSSYNRELAISVYDKNIIKWVGLLVHESCHMDQYLEDRVFWNRCINGTANFFEWLDHKREFTPRQLEKNRNLAIELELDCEKRSIEKIKKYKLPIDIKQYKQKSNTYFYGIMYCGVKRNWYNRIYSKKAIWSLAPDRFQRRYTDIPPRMYQVFEKYIN